MITKEKFKEYKFVQKSGITNMFDIKKVEEFSDLTREEIIEIMKNYGKYEEEFKKQRSAKLKNNN
jgi:hypothetical protein